MGFWVLGLSGFRVLGRRVWGVVEGLVDNPARVQKIQGGPR